MKILIIGGGGREHAIAWKLAGEGHELLCAPGNAGIAQYAHCFPDIKATDIKGMLALAHEHMPDFVLVTPDDPLAAGMVDAMEAAGIKAFGPSQAAARIESSKAFAKQLMKKHGIPTASFEVFDDMQAALDYIASNEPVFVVKADGLALGKGVIICETREAAEQAVKSMMQDEAFGEAGRSVVIEQFLSGPEVSLLCFCDGEHIVPMPPAQDHKRAFDGDRGPNTGGMGAFAPTLVMTDSVMQQTMQRIVLPTVAAMAEEGCPFKGILYFGLMITADGPYVIEYNSRFGDPETQPIMTLMQSSLADALLACIDGKLDRANICFSNDSAVCVVLASGGYPGKYTTGYPISGISQAEQAGALVFHAGTAHPTPKDDVYITAGGRVLGVTCKADSMPSAIASAYRCIDHINYTDKQFRKDIGI